MSFYTSLSGLKGAQTDLEVIAHNIANSETTGFKRSRVNFADVVASSGSSSGAVATGMGVTVAAIDQEFGIGPIDQTGAALDLAITGDGFFTTKAPASGQTAYTRAGGFQMDATGYVVNDAGERLQMLASGGTAPTDALVPRLNAAGSPFASVAVTSNGAITATYLDGTSTTVGAVALAAFVTPTGLKPIGSGNWLATGKSGAPSYAAPGASTNGTLQAGALERSNVDIAAELIDLITAQRYFQANAKAVDTATQLSQTIINLRS